MDLKIDLNKWQTNKNRGPPRQQSREKQLETQKQVEKLLKLRVIEPSTASEYSHVHFVPKPTPGEWRFCLDFVRLNDATPGMEGWPIPNIRQMIDRIGRKKAKYFGVMDMTSGYHQAPLSKSAQVFTAFITFMGVYHWLRVPMGLKGAGTYFQRVIVTVVLVGILYISCELYIDDILVYGATEDEFIYNLKVVFLRFRKHLLTLNPAKCKLGMSKIEYVGHVFDERGVTFSEAKRDKVLNFPLPERIKDLHSFLGLVNYFRDHVPNMSVKVKPLRSLMEGSDKRRKLTWTPDLEKLYYETRDEVGNCPKLFFVDEHAPVTVMTDASDYGIGAYIFQKIDGREYPIIFVSKAFHGAQLNWATPEKEGYAIFYTLTNHEHLLKGIKFLLKTDHKNLTYINMEGSPKIKRWKLALQEFNFDIEHVPGKDNIIADAFSRLCAMHHNDLEMAENLCLLDEEDIRINQLEYENIQKVHNSIVGHAGVEKTLDRLKNKGQLWKKVRKHVRKFIRECPACQKMSQIKYVIKTHPYTTAAYYPMEVLNVDTIGPLESDEDGNCYILVIIDCFSRWVELHAIKDTSAVCAAEALSEHIGRYGAPASIRSDRGTQFANELIAELCVLLRTEQELTIAYSKEENAIVERANKEVMRHLRAIIFDDRVYAKWGKRQLPLVMRILNSEEKTRTGVTPAEILFGNAVHINRGILERPLHPKSDLPKGRLSAYMDEMLANQATLIQVAKDTQLKHDTHHMSEFDPGFTEFPINSYVLLEHPEGRPHKLKMLKRGPFQVTNIVGTKYTLQDLLTGKTFDTHIANLSPFNFDPHRTDPTDVAMHDKEEFEIDSIIAHRGDKTRRKTLQFLVRWRGYAPENDSWEPYSELRDTDQLHIYLIANKLRSLIPKKFK